MAYAYVISRFPLLIEPSVAAEGFGGGPQRAGDRAFGS